MGLPPFVIIIIAFAVIAILVFVLYGTFSAKTKSSDLQNDEQNDELVYDAESGKYVTVEELVQEHNLFYLDEEKCSMIYNALPEDLKEILSLKDVETILEFHYQLKTVGLEGEEKPDEEVQYAFLTNIFEKKGKSIDKTVFSKIFAVAEDKIITK